jgi:hypothetical protein
MGSINVKLYDILRTDFKLSETKGESVNYKSELREDILKLEIKMEQNKSELLKWFIGLFFGLALMIIGLYIKK